MKVLCVLNRRAADGMGMRWWPQISDLLSSFDLDYHLLAREDASLAQQVTEHLTQVGPSVYDAIAGIGGDGTHSVILNALMAFRQSASGFRIPPYAFIPMGTGNDIAKSLGIRTRDDRFAADVRRAVAAIRYGADYQMDLGVVNGLYFADAVTIGLDSYILRERNLQKKWIARVPILRNLVRGRLLYTLSSGRPLMRHRALQCRIEVDGRLWYAGRCVNLVVNNSRIYAGEFDFSANAFANDGKLDLVLFADQNDYLARYLMSMRNTPARIRQWSEQLSKLSSQVQARRVVLTLSGPEGAQCDGEELTPASVFEIGIEPGAIAIKTPVEPV
jgi:diacylglycerol kinase family enzyme